MAQANVATLPIVHEDLSDELVLLEADDMVFSSVVKTGKPAENDIYYGPVDKRIGGGLNGIADGAKVDRTLVTNQQVNRDKIPGVIQHFRRTHGVTTLAAKVMNPAGIEDAFVDGRVKAIVQVKEDMEYSHLSQQEEQVGSTSLAFLERGASMWIDDTAQPNTALVVPTAYRPAAKLNVAVANVAAVTEKNLRTMIQNLREARRRPIKAQVFCSLDYGTHIDDFFTEQGTGTLPVRQFVTPGDAATYEIGVTRYKTRFGTLDIVPTTYLNATQNAVAVAGATSTNTSTTVAFTSTAGMQPFMRISGTGIPAGAYIVSITDSTHVVISAAATATGAFTATIGETDHALFLDMEFFEVRQNMAPTGYELPVDGGGRDGVVEAIGSLFCGYPAVGGKHYTA